MPSHAVGRSRPRKPRPASQRCQEHSACASDEPATAAFFCDQCQTFQCPACCAELHGASHRNHEPRSIPAPDPQLLCNGSGPQAACPNFADVFCAACSPLTGGSRLCVACDRKKHSGLSYSHERVPLERYLELQQRKRKEEAEADPAESPRGDWCSLEEEDIFHTLSAVTTAAPEAEEPFFSIPAAPMSSRGVVPKSERPHGAMLSTIRTEEGRCSLEPNMRPALELLDSEERLQFGSVEQFLTDLQLQPREKVTVRTRPGREIRAR